MIQVSQVRKSFGSLTAVDSVSLKVNPGEVFGLLGPNGAGKTTTLSMMVGLLQPDSGSVRIADGDPRNPDVRESIGITPQTLSLYEELTAVENLRFFGQLYERSAANLKERVQWALEFASLSDRRNDLIKTFSGGMKRRLNMAIAMVHDPQVILFDEPTVGVDPQSRNHIFDSIERLKGEGRTIIYTTHYMEEAQRLCDRVAIMDAGRILAMDSVDGLLREHGGESSIEGELENTGGTTDWAGIQEDGSFQFRATNPLEKVMQMVDAGANFRTLQIREPDLETVFLTLTGRTLRDE